MDNPYHQYIINENDLSNHIITMFWWYLHHQSSIHIIIISSIFQHQTMYQLVQDGARNNVTHKDSPTSRQDSPKVAQLLKEPFGTEAGARPGWIRCQLCCWKSAWKRNKKRVKVGFRIWSLAEMIWRSGELWLWKIDFMVTSMDVEHGFSWWTYGG